MKNDMTVEQHASVMETDEIAQDVSVKGSWRGVGGFLGAFGDISALIAIIAVGWFLIGYYTKFEFLETGYQDWIYHAFRIRDISQYGIASWDHIWGNGVNHWQAYQYVEHVLTFWITQRTGLSITHAMLWLSVVVFIAIRVLMYGALRLIGINRFLSLFTVIISYVFSQQWIGVSDFSIHIGFFVIPFYVLLWIATLNNMRYIYVLTAVTGALWSVHPVIGYSASGMLFFLVIANNLKKDIWKSFRVTVVFFISSMPFTIPYFSSGYSVTNPLFITSQFLKDMVLSEYTGLSLIFFILMAFSWVVFLMKPAESPRWAKVLLAYCTVYLVFIYFGQLGYYPGFVNKFQFSRAILLIALLLPFCFAAFLQALFARLHSRMVPTILLIVMAAGIVQAIDIASLYTGQPVKTSPDPVAIYFSDKELPQGSIYIANVSHASYFGKPGLRFIASYNQHLLASPYPLRFDSLMKTDISYTGVTDKQVQLLDDYSTVLGVEYVFVPKLSPLVDGLTENGSDSAMFEKVAEVPMPSDVYAVLHNRQPIAYAYAFEKNDTSSMVRFSDLPKPTLQSISYEPWDEEVARTAQLIRNDVLKPLPLAFGWPDRLTVDSTALASFQDPSVLVTQSYDQNWRVDTAAGMTIVPTNLRFILLTLPPGEKPPMIGLKNSWPWWHWPVQSLGIVMIILTALSVMALNRLRQEKKIRI